MALSNCRSNGQGLRLRYRLEVFGYARDDLCASGAVAALRRRSVTVHLVDVVAAWSWTDWTAGRLAAIVLDLYELCRNVAAAPTIVLSLSAAAVSRAAVQT